jgi:excisionase family DNA binding protein
MELMDVVEVAKYLKVTTKTIYRLIKKDDKIPVMRVGHLHRFSREQIYQWLLDSTKKRVNKRVRLLHRTIRVLVSLKVGLSLSNIYLLKHSSGIKYLQFRSQILARYDIRYRAGCL